MPQQFPSSNLAILFTLPRFRSSSQCVMYLGVGAFVHVVVVVVHVVVVHVVVVVDVVVVVVLYLVTSGPGTLTGGAWTKHALHMNLVSSSLLMRMPNCSIYGNP